LIILKRFDTLDVLHTVVNFFLTPQGPGVEKQRETASKRHSRGGNAVMPLHSSQAGKVSNVRCEVDEAIVVNEMKD
jgi:hypothetical protein